jgi:hypothetical protein
LMFTSHPALGVLDFLTVGIYSSAVIWLQRFDALAPQI